jgi:hypothetical protein
LRSLKQRICNPWNKNEQSDNSGSSDSDTSNVSRLSDLSNSASYARMSLTDRNTFIETENAELRKKILNAESDLRKSEEQISQLKSRNKLQE